MSMVIGDHSCGIILKGSGKSDRHAERNMHIPSGSPLGASGIAMVDCSLARLAVHCKVADVALHLMT